MTQKEDDRVYYIHAVKTSMVEPNGCISPEMEEHPNYSPMRANMLLRKLESGVNTDDLEDEEWNLLLFAMIDEWNYSDSRSMDDGLFEAIGRFCPQAKADLEEDPDRYMFKYVKKTN